MHCLKQLKSLGLQILFYIEQNHFIYYFLSKIAIEITISDQNIKILLMKQISLNCQDQKKSQFHSKRSCKLELTQRKQSISLKKETVVQNPKEKTEHSQLFSFSNQLFCHCFTSQTPPNLAKKSFHKLQNKSIQKSSKTSLSQIFDSSKKSSLKASNNLLKLEERQSNSYQLKLNFISKYDEKSTIASERLEKYNDFTISRKAQGDFFLKQNIHPERGGNQNYMKNEQKSNKKLFLSQNLKINKIQVELQKNNNKRVQTERKMSEQIDSNLLSSMNYRRQSDCNLNLWSGFSSFDSYKNDNLKVQQSQTPLQSLSAKLCETIKIEKEQIGQQNQKKSQLNFFQFDAMKDSLIDQLNVFKKSCKKENPKKKFIRSKQIQPIESLFLQEQHEKVQSKQQNSNNEEDNQNMRRYDSKQTINEKMTKNRYKSLDECGCTIVSKYKSSDKKSVLQESNIIFQASKMFEEQQKCNIKLPTFSDSQIVCSGMYHSDQTDKQYNSFVQELDINFSQSDVVNSDEKQVFVQKKTKNNSFLRSNGKHQKNKKLQNSANKQSKQNNSSQFDEMEIRFDLDTFIQYGPI